MAAADARPTTANKSKIRSIPGMPVPGSKPSTPQAKPVANTAASEPEKKIKTIKKKLKQIDEIKAKIQNGEQVELTQKQKVDTEAALLKELADLEKLTL